MTREFKKYLNTCELRLSYYFINGIMKLKYTNLSPYSSLFYIFLSLKFNIRLTESSGSKSFYKLNPIKKKEVIVFYFKDTIS